MADVPEGYEEIEKGYSLDHSFIDKREGLKTEGYIPKDKNDKILDKSGVTVGAGVDLGQWDYKSLKEAGASDAFLKKSKPYLGLKGSAAQKKLLENPLVLPSDKESIITLKDLSHSVREKNINTFNTQFKKDSGYDFKDLPSELQTVMGSVITQYGPNLKDKDRAPKFYGKAKDLDITGMRDELRNFQDKYPTRRNLEADLLEPIVPTTGKIQQKLIDKGYDPGPVDDKMGPQTEGAVRQFQEDEGLTVDGIPGNKTWQGLLSALGNFIDPVASADEIPQDVPEGYLAIPEGYVEIDSEDATQGNLDVPEGYEEVEERQTIPSARDGLSLLDKVLTSDSVDSMMNVEAISPKKKEIIDNVQRLSEQAIGQPFHSMNAALQEGFGRMLRPIAGAYDFYMDNVGIGNEGAPRGMEKFADAYFEIAAQERAKGIIGDDTASKITRGVYEGIGGLIGQAPKYIAMSMALGPAGFAGMGAVEFMEASPNGLEEASMAGVKGLAFQQYIKATSLLPRNIQLPTAFSTFGGSTLLEGGSVEDAISAGILGVGLSLTGRAPTMKEFRSRYAKTSLIDQLAKQIREMNSKKNIADFDAWKKDSTKTLNVYTRDVMKAEIDAVLKEVGNPNRSTTLVNQAYNTILNIWAKETSRRNMTKTGGTRLLTPRELILQGKVFADGLKSRTRTKLVKDLGSPKEARESFQRSPIMDMKNQALVEAYLQDQKLSRNLAEADTTMRSQGKDLTPAQEARLGVKSKDVHMMREMAGMPSGAEEDSMRKEPLSQEEAKDLGVEPGTGVQTISSLPKFEGKSFRADTGYSHNKSQKAIDVINFEEQELGNTDTSHLTPKMREELSAYPAKDIVWITKSASDAKTYGEVEEVSNLGENPRIIAEDGDGGFLVLRDTTGKAVQEVKTYTPQEKKKVVDAYSEQLKGLESRKEQLIQSVKDDGFEVVEDKGGESEAEIYQVQKDGEPVEELTGNAETLGKVLTEIDDVRDKITRVEADEPLSEIEMGAVKSKEIAPNVYKDNNPEKGVTIYGKMEGDIAKLDSINIVESKQDEDLGTKYVAKFENWAKEKGAKSVEIQAYKDSTGFWEKQGYTLEDDFKVIDGVKQDYKAGKKSLAEKEDRKTVLSKEEQAIEDARFAEEIQEDAAKAMKIAEKRDGSDKKQVIKDVNAAMVAVNKSGGTYNDALDNLAEKGYTVKKTDYNPELVPGHYGMLIKNVSEEEKGGGIETITTEALDEFIKQGEKKEPSYTVTTADIIPTRQGIQTVITDRKEYEGGVEKKSEGKQVYHLAFQRGKDDFSAGVKRVAPAELSMGSKEEWYKGWDNANLAAPIEKAGALTKEDLSNTDIISKLTGEEFANNVIRIGNKNIDDRGPNIFGDQHKKMKKGDKDWTRIKEEHDAKYNNNLQAEKPSDILKVTEEATDEKETAENVSERAGAGESVQSIVEQQRRDEHNGPTDPIEREERFGNYRITDEDKIGKGGPKAKYKDNVKAIKLLKKIESEERKATFEEQQVLVKYVGWGGLSKVFDYEYSNPDWAEEIRELRKLLTQEEYNAAKASTISAFYTSPEIITAMWDAVEHLGLKNGKFLDPSVGTGNFLGLAPNYKGTSFSAIELDSLSGRLTKQLYQHADVQIKGFQDAELPSNFYDLAITNVPFAEIKPFDRRAQMLGIPKRLVLHDFFFAKSLALLKPNGIMAFVTSKGTMDKLNSDFRSHLNKNAEFLGAVRLPSNAFKENAGTEVITDIIFMRKLKVGESPIEKDWINVSPFSVGKKEVNINNYFMNNPNNVIGTMGIGQGQFTDSELKVTALKSGIESLGPLLKEILPANIHSKSVDSAGIDITETEEIEDSSKKKDGSYIVKDGKIYVKEGNKAVAQKIDAKAEGRLKGLISLKDKVRDLLANQLHGKSDAEIKKQQSALSKEYDAFVKKYGYINDKLNEQIFLDDPDSPLLSSIEVPLKKVGKKQNYKKHDIFTKRVLVKHEKPTTAETAKDAMNISLAEYGKINWNYMSELLGKKTDDIVSELEKDDLIYKNPEGDLYEVKDEYLSGNVKIKLKIAKAAAKIDKSFEKNVKALENVIPEDLTFDQISIKAGMPWISPETHTEFLQLLGLSGAEAKMVALDGSWKVRKTTTGYWNKFNSSSNANVQEWGTPRYSATRVFEAIANGVPVKVYDIHEEDGKKVKVFNEEQTALAEDKAELMKEKFKEWFWDDEERRGHYLRVYNDQWNNTVDRKYDGSSLVFPSMNPNAFPNGLRKTQLDATWRGINSLRLMLAHAVGSGKTAVGIATLMESKRLGLIHKSMVVAQKNIIPGWRSQINQLYPSAKVLVADEKNFDKDRRARFLAKIATGEWDIIVIPESSFQFIGVSDESLKSYTDEEIARLEDHIAAMKEEGGKVSVKNEQKKIQSLKEKLKKQLETLKKDDFLTFEELGVDALLVDEADRYKNVAYTTKKQGIKGMGDPTGADKTADMMMKTKIVREKSGKLIFATGTPISNSMVEVYSMMRYLQPELLEEQRINTFDAWANNFGETDSALEVDVSGGKYKMVNRFSNFVNIQELFGMLKRVWDIQTAKMLSEQGILVKGKNLPLVNSDIEKDILPMYPALNAYIDTLIARTKAIKERRGAPQKGDDIMLTVLSDGMKATLDMRMIDPLAGKNSNSKIEKTIDGLIDKWKETKSSLGTQIVFIDRVKPNKDAKFNPHYYMRDALIQAGIPKSEIAFIHDYDTEQKKTRLFQDVNDGIVRIIFGSTEKLGAGTNIQEKLSALWHLDVPWRPRDMEQREGRIVRPGNTNKEVDIHKMVTKGSLDTFMYNTLEKKAATIEQVLSGRTKERIISEEGVDEFEAIKSLSSGNPLVKEKGDLDRDVRKLKILKTAHQKSLYQAQADVKNIPTSIQNEKNNIAEYEQFNETLPEIRPQDFEITLNGKKYTKKPNALKVIHDELKKLPPEEYKTKHKIGEYLGHDFYIGKEFMVAGDRMRNYAGISDFSGNVTDDATGTFTSINNAIFSHPDQQIQLSKNFIAESEKKLEYAQGLLKEGFPKQAELDSKTQRLVEVDKTLKKEAVESEIEREVDGDTINGPDYVPVGLGIYDVSDNYTPQENRAELENIFEEYLDIWFREKDTRIFKAKVEMRMLQKELKEALGSKKYNDRVKNFDKAIQIYIDSKNDPRHLVRYYKMLTESQQRVVDLSKNLPDEVKAIADKISASYRDIGIEAQNAEVIRNVLDNYVARVWKDTELFRKFGTQTRHGKKRKLSTIVEGWANGLDLQVEGATNNLAILKEEVVKTINDKKFVETLKQQKDIDGNPLLTTKFLKKGDLVDKQGRRAKEDYIRVEHPNFTAWEWAGQIDEGEAYGKNFFQAEDGTVMERKMLYAPKKIASDLNKILGISKLKQIASPGAQYAVDKITKYNSIIKAWILQSSLFHHFAFARSYMLGVQGKRWGEKNPFTAYKQGLAMIEAGDPMIEMLVGNGLTLGLKQDWTEELLQEKTSIGKFLDQMGATKAIKDVILEFRQKQADFLFGELGAGLKAKAALIEMRNQMKEYPNEDINITAKRVAGLINDDFGGLHLGRLKSDPTLQHIFRIFALAPDWTASNIRTMVIALGGKGKDVIHPKRRAQLYKRFWSGVLTKGILYTLLANLLMAAMDEDDEEAQGIFARFFRNYRNAWGQGKQWKRLLWSGVDITPIYRGMMRALGKTPTKNRKYFSILGHFMDVFKFAIDPLKAAHHKGSVVYSLFYEAMAGEDWAGRSYTSLSELIGVDDKGLYKRRTEKKGKVYLRGDKKGGQLAGQTVAWKFGGGGPLRYEQVPSYAVAQVIGSQPIQAQNLLGFIMGEEEGFDAIMNSSGIGVKTTYGDPKPFTKDMTGQEYRKIPSKRKKRANGELYIKEGPLWTQVKITDE